MSKNSRLLNSFFVTAFASATAFSLFYQDTNNKCDRPNGSDNPLIPNCCEKILSGHADWSPDENRYYHEIDLVIAAVLSAAAIARSKIPEEAASQLEQAPKPVPQAENFDNRQAQKAQERKFEADRSQKVSEFFTKVASQVVREMHQIGQGDTLNSLAEQRFNNRNLDHLLARINRGRIKEHTVDGQTVVELTVGQTIEIPTQEEVERYMRSQLGRANGRIMTIISEPVSPSTVKKALSKLV